jgi:carboxyl-terminal processing protease
MYASLMVTLLTPARADETLATIDDYRRIHLFFETLEKVQDYYVDDLSTEKLVQMAIDGIVQNLDNHTRFMEPGDFEGLKAKTQGRFFGVGVVVALRGEYPTVISPIDDTPAKRAGVRPGDRIVAIDGEDAHGLSLEDVVVRLRGGEGSLVHLSVERDGIPSPLDFVLAREEIRVESTLGPLYPDPELAYIRIRRFSESTGEEFVKALEALDTQVVQGLVVDLRGNPGGLLSQAVLVADRFVPPGEVIVEIRSRNRTDCRTYRSAPGPKWTLPVAILVDEGSASAAEIVAGALQDHGNGVVIGQPTFGKGSVQSIFAFEAGHALKLTTAHYYTPSGRSVERRPLSAEIRAAEGIPDSVEFTGGIQPNVLVATEVADSLLVRLVLGGHTTDFIAVEMEQAPEDLSQPLHADYIASFKAFVSGRSDFPIGLVADIELDRALREELALRDGGETGALQVRLAWDVQYEEAVKVLRIGRPEVAAVGVPTDTP